MIGLDLSTSGKLAVWIIRSRLNLGFSLSYFSFLLKFVHLELFLFILNILKLFYPRINKPNMPITSPAFQVSKIGLTTSLARSFHFKSRAIDCSHKRKFLIFGNFSKSTILRL